MLQRKNNTMSKTIKIDNYLSNCYRELIRSKIIHFLFLLMDISLLLLQEIDLLNSGFRPRYQNNAKFISPIIILIKKCDKLPIYINFLLIILTLLFFDSLYILLCKIDFKHKNIIILIIINILELFYFRLFILFFCCLLFSLSNLYLLPSFILFLFHAYLIINNFFYNHLYYYVPEFVEYPYDTFSSLFDIFLFSIKIILSIASDTNDIDLAKFWYLIYFIIKVYFSYFFIDKLIHHSYLFMKNTFLNRMKISLFLAETMIIIISYLFLEKKIYSILYIFINIGIIIIFIGFLFCIYNPISYININNKSYNENIFYYLNMINAKNNMLFLIENKLKNHYGQCGLCNLCKKYAKCITYENNKNSFSEKDLLITDKKSITKTIDLFDIFYDGKTKYFKLIRNLEMCYKKCGKNIFNNNLYFYINLLYLIYSDFLNNDITLSLNEKIIFDIINVENQIILEEHQTKINQLILCKDYIYFCKIALNLIKEILGNEQNFFKVQKLLTLSIILNNLKKKKFKKNLLNYKNENLNNTRNILLSCSIVYEELFNTTINISQIAIRDNIPFLEDIFGRNSKNNNILSLELNLINNNCIIIRAGIGLSSYINQNLYDLFPNTFKQYQINLFLNSIFKGFNNEQKDFIINNNNKNNKNKETKIKNKNGFIELKLILNEIFSFSYKSYYKVLNLKITPFFNNDINHIIIFNGTYYFNNNIIISKINLSNKYECNEMIFGFSNPNLECELESNSSNSININNYTSSQLELNKDFKLVKIFSYKISIKLYNIYKIEQKKDENKNKNRKDSVQKYNTIKRDETKDDSEEEANSHKIKLYEEANSIVSTLQSSKGLNLLGINKTSNRDNIINYKLFNINQKIIYFIFILVLIIIIIEYIYFNNSTNNLINNNNSYINYRGFYRLYYQLFASILGVACIPETIDSKKCRNFISIFNNLYSKNYPDKTFNFTEYLLIQNRILVKRIIEEKSNIIKINNYMGTKRYNELFYTKMKYIELNQKIINNTYFCYTEEINVEFFNALLILCNSFVILTEDSNTILNQPIYFINKSDNSFDNFYYKNELSNYQKEVYKLILNYKYFSQEFSLKDKEIFETLKGKVGIIKAIIFLSISLNVVLYIVIVVLINIYLIFFNKIIIRIINNVIMIINTKSDGFDYKETFRQKIENLEIILELYRTNPLEAIQNLNVIYSQYNQYLINKNKSDIRNNKKLSNINNDDIPENIKIMSIEDINKLKINNKYYYVLILIIILIIIILCIFLILWINYFIIDSELFIIVSQNSKLEESCYEAINLYELMIFNNFTLDEITNYLGNSNLIKEDKNEKDISNIIFNNFYQHLHSVFEIEKYHKNIECSYEVFEELEEFNCLNLISTFKYEIIEEVDEIMTDLDLKQKLVDICTISHITESEDVKTIFEKHFQFIKNGMISLTDFSYEGLNKNLESTIIGRIAFFFFTTTIYIIDLTIIIPHKKNIKTLMDLFWNRILITEIIFIVFGVGLILVILLFYIYNINKFCNQLLLLRKTFNICEIHEQ